MASSFKVPIAVQLLARVDRGEVHLDQMVNIEPHDLHPGSGTLTSLFSKPGVSLSVRNLLELMLLISDNSATDIVLRLAGGPEAVTAKMRDLGIAGIDVNRPTVNLIADCVGATLPPENEWVPDMFDRLFDAVPAEQAKQARDRFNQDPRDTAQPTAMGALLEKIYQKRLHKPARRTCCSTSYIAAGLARRASRAFFRREPRWPTKPAPSAEPSMTSA